MYALREPPEEPPCSVCWPDCLEENKESIFAFLKLCRQIKFDTAGRAMDVDMTAVVLYITSVYDKDKWKLLIGDVVKLIKKVGIPAYIEEVKK